MAKNLKATMDGNSAAAHVAYAFAEVAAIYPITPSSTMGELADAWAADGRKNINGTTVDVIEMQSEAGAAGAVHGALSAGAVTTTFTASQGLMLMLPNMHKIAGEMLPTVFYVTARSLAAQSLSIFGDHADVMSARNTGWALIAANSVQEVMDLGLVAQLATLKTSIPFLVFFDGFRTSHELQKVDVIDYETMAELSDPALVEAFRRRALNPEHPRVKVGQQNPDVYFQGRETSNKHYLDAPGSIAATMEEVAAKIGRAYKPFDYIGHPAAEHVIVAMGSGCEAIEETVTYLNEKRGMKLGLIKVRVYRPFSVEHFQAVLPASVKNIAVLDRTKEPGSIGEPLYLDVVSALKDRPGLFIIGGRYGLSSKDFTPTMILAVYKHLMAKGFHGFTVGIEDDLTKISLPLDEYIDPSPEGTINCKFWGLGSDGTVGANKNSIKIIGEDTDLYAQGYFVYDSKKSGAITVSHLRFGHGRIRSTYLVRRANFVACHQFSFLDRYDVVGCAEPGATLLLNAPYAADQVWERLAREVQEEIIARRLRVFVIDAYRVAGEAGMGRRINTVMQTCFFAISGVLPRDEAIEKIKKAIRKTYEKKGEAIVARNFAAVDQTLANLHELSVPAAVSATRGLPPVVPPEAPDFVQRVTAVMLANRGDDLPVSAFPPDGTCPTGTTQWEKRNIALEIPVWDPKTCIQCGKCAVVCPHAAIRMKVYDAAALAGAPGTFKSCDARAPEWKGMKYTIQVAPEDCTGCVLCVDACPAKNKTEVKLKAINMQPQAPLRVPERENWAFFLKIPDLDRRKIKVTQLRQQQVMRPLFEFSGACAGCGETPYLKLLTQLFGDRMLIANATGCSSI